MKVKKDEKVGLRFRTTQRRRRAQIKRRKKKGGELGEGQSYVVIGSREVLKLGSETQNFLHLCCGVELQILTDTEKKKDATPMKDSGLYINR